MPEGQQLGVRKPLQFTLWGLLKHLDCRVWTAQEGSYRTASPTRLCTDRDADPAPQDRRSVLNNGTGSLSSRPSALLSFSAASQAGRPPRPRARPCHIDVRAPPHSDTVMRGFASMHVCMKVSACFLHGYVHDYIQHVKRLACVHDACTHVRIYAYMHVCI